MPTRAAEPAAPGVGAAAKEVALLASQKGLDLPIMGGVRRILNREIEPRAFLEGYLADLGAALGRD